MTYRLSEEWMAETQSSCNKVSPGSGADSRFMYWISTSASYIRTQETTIAVTNAKIIVTLLQGHFI